MLYLLSLQSTLIQDILLSAFLIIGYLGGGITASFFASEWNNYTSDTIDKILTSLAVAAVRVYADFGGRRIGGRGIHIHK